MINNSIKAKKLISTIPLNELVYLINDVPEYILSMAKRLDYNSVAIIGVALKRKSPEIHWIYVPDKAVSFHRVAWLSNYSPYNTPDTNKSLLVAEITILPQESLDKDKILNRSLNELEKLGIISREEIIFTKVWFHKYGYPVHTLRTIEARNKIIDYLSEMGLTVFGRWGMWKYINMDKMYKESKVLATTFKLR